jgi:hypothetical protein
MPNRLDGGYQKQLELCSSFNKVRLSRSGCGSMSRQSRAVARQTQPRAVGSKNSAISNNATIDDIVQLRPFAPTMTSASNLPMEWKVCRGSICRARQMPFCRPWRAVARVCRSDRQRFPRQGIAPQVQMGVVWSGNRRPSGGCWPKHI